MGEGIADDFSFRLYQVIQEPAVASVEDVEQVVEIEQVIHCIMDPVEHAFGPAALLCFASAVSVVARCMSVGALRRTELRLFARLLCSVRGFQALDKLDWSAAAVANKAPARAFGHK